MTEPRLRELYVWIQAHRMSMIDHAGELAELAAIVRGVDLRTELGATLARISNRCQVLSMEIAGALSELERIHPMDLAADEDTAVDLPAPDPDADTVPGVPPPASPRKRLTGRPA